MKMKKYIAYVRWAFRIACLVPAVGVLLWIFAVDRFTVSSGSMAPALLPGDRILVDKLTFGARIYTRFEFEQGVPLRSFRMPGFRRLRVNDVVVFNVPRGYDRRRIEFRINYLYAKRCIGTPGDSISVCGGYFRNSRYRGPIGDTEQQRLLGETPDSLVAPEALGALPYCNRRHRWTIRNLGPVYVPRRGDRIVLDSLSGALYGPIIEYETGESLTCREGEWFLGDRPCSDYRFRGDCYFCCGDRVADSKDSRYWGFVPEEFVVGIVRRICSSRDPYTHKRRSERRWKKIN